MYQEHVDRVIVTRHRGAAEFVAGELGGRVSPDGKILSVPYQDGEDLYFLSIPILESATPDDVRGKVVFGNLPLHLAALAAQVVAVEFAGAAPRGAEYGIEEMRAAGARLAYYGVISLPADRTRDQYLNDGGFAV